MLFSRRPSRRRVTPRIYGNLQAAPKKPSRSYAALLSWALPVLFGVALVTVFCGPWMRIRVVEVSGAVLVSSDEVAEAVPRGALTLFWNDGDFLAAMRAQYPNVQFRVQRGIPDRVQITVIETAPALVWESAGQRAILTKQGGVIAVRSTSESLPEIISTLPHVVDAQNLPIIPSNELVSQAFVEAVSAVYNEVPVEVPSEKIVQVEVGATTYEVTVVLESGRRLRLTTLGDIAVQLRNVQRILSQATIAPSATLDMRVDGWAYAR